MRFTCIALAAVALALAKPNVAPGLASSVTDKTAAVRSERNASSPLSSTPGLMSTSASNGEIDFTPVPSGDDAARESTAGAAFSPSSDPTRCAAVKMDDRSAALVVVSCAPGEAQLFGFASGQIRTAGQMCVVAPASRDNAVRPVTLETCNGSPAQRWSAAENGEYRSYRGKCLTAAGPQRRAGTPVAVRRCMGRSDQRWAQRRVPTLHTQVDSIRLNAVALSLAAGSTSRVNAAVIDFDGHEIAGEPVSWASSDPAVASVSPDGVVTAVGGGSTTVVAMTRGRVKSVAVEVRSAQYAGLESGTATYGANKQ